MTRTKRLLDATGWTEPRLAEWLGISQSTVNRMKHGADERGPVSRLLDQLESDLAAGRIAPDAAADPLPAQPEDNHERA